MHSIAARIALLAYVVGGMAMPVLHRHDGGLLHGTASVHGHTHGTHSHSHATCHHQQAGDVAATTANSERCEERDATTAVVGNAPAEQASACSDNCVVCSFAGSPQSPASALAVALSLSGIPQLAPGHDGPGFEAPASRHNRLRGPPASLILG